MPRHHLSHLMVLAAALAAPVPAAAVNPRGKVAPAPARVQLYLVDTSGSMEQLRDATQACLTHQMKLAELAGEQIKVAVVFFGGHGVKVVGDQGKPTAATRSLLGRLLREWPRPAGGTPMDSAFARAVHLVGALPAGTEVTLVLFTDGQPESGTVRPEAFREVKTLIERDLKATEDLFKDAGAAFVQKVLASKK